MALPLLNYAPTTQNSRVAGFEVPGDEQPKQYNTEDQYSPVQFDEVIWAAYRQLFFHAFKCDRQVVLESQLRNGQITVRDFVRGLLLSDTFRSSFYEKNSNYRFVEQVVQRVLGRDVYGEREKIAWSLAVATQGYEGFIDTLLNSEEYLSNFGYDKVPYQRRRILPGRALGETPFNIKSPRYDAYYRTILGFPKAVYAGGPVKRFPAQYLSAKAGDPGSYLELARSIGARGQAIGASADIDYLNKVPYRKR